MTFSPRSKDRLTDYDFGRFAGDTLFDRVARAVCAAGCLPRKELYESWEVARRARRRFRGGRVMDVGGGHGLLALLMLLLDDTSAQAVIVDPAVPPSAARVQHAITSAWPRLDGRLRVVRARIGEPGWNVQAFRSGRRRFRPQLRRRTVCSSELVVRRRAEHVRSAPRRP